LDDRECSRTLVLEHADLEIVACVMRGLREAGFTVPEPTLILHVPRGDRAWESSVEEREANEIAERYGAGWGT
jgi:hypothetical protein